MRHTAITNLAESQNSDQTIMSIAGHVSRQMLEHYSHIRMEAKRRAVEALSLPRVSPSCVQEGALELATVQSTSQKLLPVAN